VERFIKTIDDECFRIVQPHSSRARVGALKLFLDYYNHARPRDAYLAELGGKQLTTELTFRFVRENLPRPTSGGT
jgi:hypothetical protein